MKSAFAHQISEGLNQKAVVFTESKRTPKYIAAELRKSGYSEEDILLFNGDFDDAMTKEIFRTWQVKNFGKTNYGRSVEYKHAIVDYFKSHAKILIVTDAGSEGLNLQFCNTIINYDLPWNPQKIEQRIGRCHRYGQTHDVVAINLLNTDNEADRRVYDILSKKFELFEGVFGASDVALGALESGVSFEKRILDIYQNCKNITAVRKAFAALNRQLDARKNAHVAELRSILLTESREAKGQALEKTKADIDKYLRDVEYWNQFEEPEVDHKLHYWKIDNWGEKIFGSHSLLDELEMRWEDEQKLNGLSSVHSMGFRQFIFYLAHKVDFIAEIFLCTMILFGNVGAQPAASFLLKFASFAKFLKQPESLCCFCTNQIFNFFSCNTAVFQCILKNE